MQGKRADLCENGTADLAIVIFIQLEKDLLYEL